MPVAEQSVWSSSGATATELYARAMCKLEMPSGGFLRHAWGTDDDKSVPEEPNTWFTGGDLHELPRRVWLAINGFVQLEGAAKGQSG